MKAKSKSSLMDIAGILTKKESELLRKSVKETRLAMRKRIGKTAKRLSK
ncbi:MAG: hypothetical protein HYW25_00620 [Candidatus Aenigmarchaeota archaeon]|nr:hypothetical protein [Candidatus Aenigmarchaeota archaeon]